MLSKALQNVSKHKALQGTFAQLEMQVHALQKQKPYSSSLALRIFTLSLHRYKEIETEVRVKNDADRISLCR